MLVIIKNVLSIDCVIKITSSIRIITPIGIVVALTAKGRIYELGVGRRVGKRDSVNSGGGWKSICPLRRLHGNGDNPSSIPAQPRGTKRLREEVELPV